MWRIDWAGGHRLCRAAGRMVVAYSDGFVEVLRRSWFLNRFVVSV